MFTTATCTCAKVDADDGVSWIHGSDAFVVNGWLRVTDPTATVCVAGSFAPCCHWNVRMAGASVSRGGSSTCSTICTWICPGFVFGATIVRNAEVFPICTEGGAKELTNHSTPLPYKDHGA